MSIPAQEFVSGFPVSLDPAQVERQLLELWDTRAGGEDQGAAITRITLGNVLWMGESSQVGPVREVFRELVLEYSCRLFLLELSDEVEGIDAHVNAYCFLTGSRRQICCEEIHLRVGPNGREHLRGAVLPLLVSDVPTTLWTRRAPEGLQGSCTAGLLTMADVVVREVGYLDHPAENLRELSTSKGVVLDLSWFHQAPLRTQIASAFQDRKTTEVTPSENSLRLRWSCGDAQHPCPSATIGVLLVVGWIADRLSWDYEDDDVNLSLEPVYDHQSSPGQILEMDLAVRGVGRIQLDAGDSRSAAAPLSDAQALGLALTSRTRGETFRRSAGKAWPLVDARVSLTAQPAGDASL